MGANFVLQITVIGLSETCMGMGTEITLYPVAIADFIFISLPSPPTPLNLHSTPPVPAKIFPLFLLDARSYISQLRECGFRSALTKSMY